MAIRTYRARGGRTLPERTGWLIGDRFVADLSYRWRADAGVFARLDLWELGRVLERCARELEEALSDPRNPPPAAPGQGGHGRP